MGLAAAGCGSALSVLVTGLALLLTLAALSMYHGYGFVQYDRLEDVQAALDGEKGRLYKGYRLGKEKLLLALLTPACVREEECCCFKALWKGPNGWP